MNPAQLTIRIDPATYRKDILDTYSKEFDNSFFSKRLMDQMISGMAMGHTHEYGDPFQFSAEERREKDETFFWKRHVLLKTLDKDDDGHTVTMYSLVPVQDKRIDGGEYDLSNTVLDDETSFTSGRKQAERYLDPQIFQEVAENRYELLIEEEDLPKNIRIEKA